MLLDIVFYIFGMLLGTVNLITRAIGMLIPDSASSAITTMFATLGNLNDILPVSTAVAILLASFVLATAIFVWRTWWWLYSKIPFIGR